MQPAVSFGQNKITFRIVDLFGLRFAFSKKLTADES